MQKPTLVRVAVMLLLSSSLASRAGAATPLLEGEFLWEPADEVDHVSCLLLVDGGSFEARLDLQNLDASKLVVGLSFDAVQPTSVSRGEDKVSVKESRFVSMSVSVDHVPLVMGNRVANCALGASFTSSTSKGTSALSCKGDDLSLLLNDDQIASVQSALASLKHVKFKVDSDHHKWSISSQCSGTFVP
ncbi:MAG TPA: hypothetical protein VMR50_15115 [Myxococcota bacterium]|nr:hypothetical protein [Myxococcota bacterium]